MSKFPQKKFQVFVSSTYEDLKEERQAAVEAILSAGHIPAGMELFAAGDQSQMEIIKEWIDESDIYLLILGGRYGSIEPQSGKSYIHLEYEHALEKGKPLFSCVLDNPNQRAMKLENIEKYLETNNPAKYKSFKDLVMTKMIRKWSDSKDIKLSIMQALQDFVRREYLIGWVKSDNQINLASITDEIARLSKENNELRQKLANCSKIESSKEISYEEIRFILESTSINKLSFFNVSKLKKSNLLYFFVEIAYKTKLNDGHLIY